MSDDMSIVRKDTKCDISTTASMVCVSMSDDMSTVRKEID